LFRVNPVQQVESDINHIPLTWWISDHVFVSCVFTGEKPKSNKSYLNYSGVHYYAKSFRAVIHDAVIIIIFSHRLRHIINLCIVGRSFWQQWRIRARNTCAENGNWQFPDKL